MTKEELAIELSGRNRNQEMTKSMEQAANHSGLLVIFGASDDLVEFRGIVYDELGAYDGTDLVVFKHKDKVDVCTDHDDEEDYNGEFSARQIVDILDSKERGNRVKVEWCPLDAKGEIIASWVISTDLPRAVFEIMDDEDEEVFCQGIIIDVNDLK